MNVLGQEILDILYAQIYKFMQNPTIRTNILLEEQRLITRQIFEHIKGEKTKSILMHCHPSPDPDSLGSVLGMKFALESIGKKVTVIAGDSKIPDAFMHFSGAQDILTQNYFEIDLANFDTFIILDSGSPSMVSRKAPVIFPPDTNSSLKTIVIDHHASNTGYGDINLVATQYISTTEIVFDLLQEWNISITKEIAENLYIGLFTDGGGFRYERVTDHSFYMASVLYFYNSNILKTVESMENSATSKSVDFLGLALTQKKVYEVGANDGADGVGGVHGEGPVNNNGSYVISYITYEDIQRLGLTSDDWNGGMVNIILKSVVGWNVVALLIEQTPGEVKCSFRTRDQAKFDVSRVAVALGGGGHKAAAGAMVKKPISEAVEEVSNMVRKVLFS